MCNINTDPKVKVITVTYNSINNLDAYFSTLLDQDFSSYDIFIIDNDSQDKTRLQLEFYRNHPKVTLYFAESNLGFARANNIGMQRAFEQEGYDYCLLINDDVEVEKDLITKLIQAYSSGGQVVGLVQPLVMLYDNREELNTDGNAIHYLGFGYCKNYKKKPQEAQKRLVPIISPSGACLMISKEFYKDVGGFNEDFFMYSEDQDLAWRGLLMGYTHLLDTSARIYHKYAFQKGNYKFFHAEKNRLRMINQNYERKTLLLLFPLLIVNELFMLVYALIDGWFRFKLLGYWDFFKSHQKRCQTRELIQRRRKVRDRSLFGRFTSSLSFSPIPSRLIKFVINPLYNAYYRLVRKLL